MEKRNFMGYSDSSGSEKAFLDDFLHIMMIQKSDRLLNIFEKYREKNLEVPILVEGKRDVSSLRKLEFNGEIINLNSGHTLLGKVELLADKYREVIILTDFDHKGIFLKKRITTYFNSMGTEADTYLWTFILRFLPAKTVEELPWAYEKALEVRQRITKIRLKPST